MLFLKVNAICLFCRIVQKYAKGVYVYCLFCQSHNQTNKLSNNDQKTEITQVERLIKQIKLIYKILHISLQ